MVSLFGWREADKCIGASAHFFSSAGVRLRHSASGKKSIIRTKCAPLIVVSSFLKKKIELLRFKAEMVRVRMKLGWPVRVRERVDDRLWTPLSKADVMK